MADQEITLMKGNEAIAHAAIRCGCDGYFGYPITPQSEVLETLAEQKPWETTGMVVLQAESEVSSINMVYGGAATGKKVMTSSSSPGVSLMQEGISYMAGAELPALIVNVMRGGPGLGTIQPSQSDYFQACKGGGHGDYHLIVLAPASVLPPFKPRRTEEEIIKECPWATTGRVGGRKPNIITSLELRSEEMEIINLRIQAKYREIEAKEVRCEKFMLDDAEYAIVAFGSAARIAKKSIEIARSQGIKVGLLRPITLWPFPVQEVKELASRVKGILSLEINAGQMVEDIRLAVEGAVPVRHFGRLGGIIPDPDEVVDVLKSSF